ncbi:MAG TPA: MerR family transcriptional regulator [Balneolaceae bacterium]|nr:MerR family transcriptional regulator [Balneolaceae bacterium]
MKKLYYSIGEVSEITGIEPHVLRYWESVFDDLSPKKNKAGNRVFKEKDIKTVVRLKKLIKDKKYSTKGAKQVLENEETVRSTDQELPAEVQKDLQEIRLFLKKILEKL